MSRRERYRRFGLGSPGPEIRWVGGKPKPARKHRPKVKRKSPPRPQKPTGLCGSPSCTSPPRPALPGRLSCGACAERLEALADEHRRSAS